MFNNTAIKIATSKLASTSLLPGSFFLISGIVVWQLWRINVELKDVKKQVAEINVANTVDSESVTPVSSSLNESETVADTKTSPEKMGLFEYLINDNIQIRQHS